jgi:transposase
MAARSRDSVERQPSSGSQMTYTDFLRLFPNNAACMDYLRDRFYPSGAPCPHCGKPTKFHRIKSRSAYACQYCRHQVYPTAGTIFHKSTTSLQLWFWAVFLMSSTRCGISAKQLEREIGVSYKTAHRMFKQIRGLLSDDGDEPLSGEVEADESGYGGKPRAKHVATGTAYKRRSEQPTIFAMVERGGRVRPRVIGGRSTGHLQEQMNKHVLPSSMIFTDEWRGYDAIGPQYRDHRRIKHTARVYVEGTTHTQTVEGFFGLFKTGVRGVYHAISTTYLQNYLDEYAWRYNHRHDTKPMFWSILDQVRKASVAS